MKMRLKSGAQGALTCDDQNTKLGFMRRRIYLRKYGAKPGGSPFIQSILLITGVLVLALFSRFTGLETSDAAVEEAFFLNAAAAPICETTSCAADGFRGPIYPMILKLYLGVRGGRDDETRLHQARAFSAAISWITAACLAALVYCFSSKRLGIIAAALTGFSPNLCRAAREVSTESTVAFLGVIALGVLIARTRFMFVDAKKRRLTIVLLFCVNIIGVFISFGFFWFLAAEFACLLLFRRWFHPELKSFLIAAAIPFTLGSAYAAYLLFTRGAPGVYGQRISWQALPDTALFLSVQPWPQSFPYASLPVFLIGLALVYWLVFKGVVGIFSSDEAHRKAMFAMTALFFLTPVLGGLITARIYPVLIPGRFDSIAIPPMIFLAVLGLSRIRPPVLQAVPGALVAFAAVLGFLATQPPPERSRSNTVVNLAWIYGKKGETAVIYPGNNSPVIQRRLEKKFDFTIRVPDNWGVPGWPEAAFSLDPDSVRQILDPVFHKLDGLGDRISLIILLRSDDVPLMTVLEQSLDERYYRVREARTPRGSDPGEIGRLIVYSTQPESVEEKPDDESERRLHEIPGLRQAPISNGHNAFFGL